MGVLPFFFVPVTAPGALFSVRRMLFFCPGMLGTLLLRHFPAFFGNTHPARVEYSGQRPELGRVFQLTNGLHIEPRGEQVLRVFRKRAAAVGHLGRQVAVQELAEFVGKTLLLFRLEKLLQGFGELFDDTEEESRLLEAMNGIRNQFAKKAVRRSG